jgi:hypothetical protein
MNQYLNDTLADTTHRLGVRYRDDHHHPHIFDVISAGNEGRPSFYHEWFSKLDEWTRSCNELFHLPLVQNLLAVADKREYEEDVACITSRWSSCFYSDSEDRKERARSISGGSEVLNGTSTTNQLGRLDACIKRTANMDLSTAQRANENTIWLSKEIRSLRKKLKQISQLLDAEAKSIILTMEQKAKVERRPVLENELNVYESAMEEVKARIKEIHDNTAGCEVSLETPRRTICKENDAPIATFSEEKIIECSDKVDERSGDDEEDNGEAKSDRLYFCDVCKVKCSDKSNLILHRNGRKHRNRLAQVVEEEKKKAAASILEKKQTEEMKNPSRKIHSCNASRKNAWGVSSTPPKFKLPPPPHPVVPQVTPVSKTSSKKEIKNDATKYLKGMASVSAPVSNFEEIMVNTSLCRKSASNTASSKVAPAQDCSPYSTSCVPLSLYTVAPTDIGNHGSLSLGEFLPTANPTSTPSGTSAPAPWLSSASAKSLSSKTLMQIQAEEVNLKTREDKSSGIVGGSWFVERRERASSLLEIQQGARQEQEERLVVEEQFMIEAQIMEENLRLKKEEERIKRKSQLMSKHNKRNKAKAKNTSKGPADGSSKLNFSQNV